MSIKIEYSFEDWRDWFLLERKGFVIKAPFVPLKVEFKKDQKTLDEKKFKIPLNVKKMYVLYTRSWDRAIIPDEFLLQPLEGFGDDPRVQIGPMSIYPLTFKKVEGSKDLFYSSHKVVVADVAKDACGEKNCIRKFRFYKGLMGYAAK